MQKLTAILLICLVSQTLTTSPAKQILNEIDGFVQATRNEQSKQTKIYVEQHKDCAKQLAFRAQEVQDARVASGWADQQILLNNAALPIAKSSLKQTIIQTKTMTAAIQSINIQHGVETRIYLQKQKDIAEAINAIQGTYNIIGSFASGKAALASNAVFLEVSQKINKVFKIALKHDFHSQMIPVMNSLVQLTSNSASTVSTNELVKAVKFLRAFEKEIRIAGNQSEQSNKALNSSNTKQIALITQQLTVLRQIYKKLRDFTGRLIGQIASQKTALKLAMSSLKRNEKILKATTQQCTGFDAKYREQTKERTAYVALLGNLRKFISTTISSYKSGIYA